MRIAAAAFLIGGGFVLAACETGPPISPAQCSVADWRAVGDQDGASGRAPERFVALQQACAAVGLGADQSLYMQGRGEGLATYCQPDRGFRLGLAGTGYNGVCPPDLDVVFRGAHDDGMRAYNALSAQRSAESTISSLRSEREDIEHKIDANEAGLIASQTDAERQRHRDELIHLRDDRNRIEGRLRDAEYDQRDRGRDVTRLRGELGFRYGTW